MDAIQEFLQSDWWVTRNNCGWFPVWLIILYAGSNLAIGIAYAIIAFMLRVFEQEGTTVFTPYYSRLFAMFISACGLGHVIDGVMAFFWPNYLVFAMWHAYTAIVSVFVSVAMIHMRHDIRDAVNQHRLTELARQKVAVMSPADVSELRTQVEELQALYRQMD